MQARPGAEPAALLERHLVSDSVARMAVQLDMRKRIKGNLPEDNLADDDKSREP